MDLHRQPRTLSEQPDEAERVRAARADAHVLGYMLDVAEAMNMGVVTHMAHALPLIQGQAVVGKFLAYGTSAGDAAEKGVAVLRGICENNDPWPKGA